MICVNNFVIGVNQFALVTLADTHDYVPPRPLGKHADILFDVGIAPLETLVRVAVAAAFVIIVCGSFYPIFKKSLMVYTCPCSWHCHGCDCSHALSSNE